VAARPDGPRIGPLPIREWPSGMRAAMDALTPPEPRHPVPGPQRDPSRPKGLNILGTMARHPALATAFHTFNGHILYATSLSTRQRELLVLRVATVRRCEYEWLQHTVVAGDVGIDADTLTRVQRGPEADGWDPLDRAMVLAVDELLSDAWVSDATWARLAVELDQQQLMDLVFTVGAYDLVAMAMRSFGVEVDDDLAVWK
jgi:alkylhydroperoxidase family enzyme